MGQLRGIAVGMIIALAVWCRCAVAADAPDCQSCHPDKVEGRFVHAPAHTGDCLACHKLAAGKSHPRDRGSCRPVASGAKLCYLCHDNKADKRHVHGPVATGDCVSCHDPHKSANPRQLKALGAQLCLMCHESNYNLKYVHAPVVTGNCLGCHDPHQSDSRMHLKKYGVALCLLCHKQSLVEGESVHAPVAEGDCLVCHRPHDAANRKLLTGYFPEEFALPYADGNFALCFGCHNSLLATDERTISLTSFRNGDRNLHAVHINKPDLGRSCKTCHDPHAAGQQRLVRSRVPGYGKWKIPISYTMTATGGTCVVGCHKTRSYDRQEPVSYE